MRSLMAIGPVAAVAAVLPEPTTVARIENAKGYVIEFEKHLSNVQIARLKEQWELAFKGPGKGKAPKLIVLDGGAKLKAVV